MAFFKQLESLLQEGDQVTVVVTKAQDGRLSAAVVITPAEASSQSVSPYVATGTAEELDENIVVDLPKLTETVKGFHSNLAQVESEAKKKTKKATATKKEDTKPAEKTPAKKKGTDEEQAPAVTEVAEETTQEQEAPSGAVAQPEDEQQPQETEATPAEMSPEEAEAKVAAEVAMRKEKAKELWFKASDLVKEGKLAEAKEVLKENLKYCSDKQGVVINREIANINAKLGIKEE